jgi:hypothetical protein
MMRAMLGALDLGSGFFVLTAVTAQENMSCELVKRAKGAGHAPKPLVSCDPRVPPHAGRRCRAPETCRENRYDLATSSSDFRWSQNSEHGLARLLELAACPVT